MQGRDARRRSAPTRRLRDDRRSTTTAAHAPRSPCARPRAPSRRRPDELGEGRRRRVGAPRVARARRRAARPALQPPGGRRRRPEDARAIPSACSRVDAMLADAPGRRAGARGHAPHEARAQAPRPHGQEPLRARSSRARCFAGSLLELALAADRVYMLDDADERRACALSPHERRAAADGATA